MHEQNFASLNNCSFVTTLARGYGSSVESPHSNWS